MAVVAEFSMNLPALLTRFCCERAMVSPAKITTYRHSVESICQQCIEENEVYASQLGPEKVVDRAFLRMLLRQLNGIEKLILERLDDNPPREFYCYNCHQRIDLPIKYAMQDLRGKTHVWCSEACVRAKPLEGG